VGDFERQTKDLIDNLKATCATYGLGNDGNEFKIITQVFLYKFLNDKFGFELKHLNSRFKKAKNWEAELGLLSDVELAKVTKLLDPSTAKLKKEHLLSNLYNKQNEPNFSKIFDSVLLEISLINSAIFSVNTSNNSKITLFEELSLYVNEPSNRDDFCKALVNQLVNFSFEQIFEQKFDFFSTIFEYLIKDYNKDGGGKYAEYYTPHSVSKIMAQILVNKSVKNVSVYDPSAGSGTLLMNVAHEIGEKNCSIYSQDISQKSSTMLRLNLILNDLVHSFPNIIQGDTLIEPFHRDKGDLKKFDFIVSNPPFKLDFSESISKLNAPENRQRFFAGIPSIPPKDKDKMPIYLLFLQHIIHSMADTSKAAVVVPTGFLTEKNGIAPKIREYLITKKILSGVISMPPNIFATTATNVSVLLLEKGSISDSVYLMDASNLGTTVKEGKNKKTYLSESETDLIIKTYRGKTYVEKFSISVKFDDIAKKKFSLNSGQYLPILSNNQVLKFDEFIGQLNSLIVDLETEVAALQNNNATVLKTLKNLKE
jgi:type I restriction enzyme M protein